MAGEEQLRTLDVRPDRVDLRDREFRPALRSVPPQYPPADAIEHYLPTYEPFILDQGSEGACTGFGLACVVNFLQWSRNWRNALLYDIDGGVDSWPEPGDVTAVSPRMLYHLARFYDEWAGEDYVGSSCRGAVKGWHRHGVCSDELWPYRDKHNRVVFVPPKPGWQEDAAQRPIGAYYRVDKNSVSDLQAAIFEVGAVYVSAKVHDGWFLGEESTVPTIEYDPETRGGHAFALVGYMREGFLVQNSWGPDWGYHGFAILTYADWVENGMDAWVSVLGAPSQSLAETTYIRSHSAARQDVAVTGSRSSVGESRYVYQNDEVRPWSTSRAVQHTVVLGNNGTPLNRLVHARDGADAVRITVAQRVDQWLQQKLTNRKVVIYGHGGLTSEEDAIKRVQIMGPYFLANDVYPLFINWKTGVRETLRYLTADVLHGSGAQAPRSAGWFDGLHDWIGDVANRSREAADRTFELAAERLVKPFWSQMKQNAAAASCPGRGTQLVMEHLLDLKARYDDLEVHLVGHSAGSILLGEMLDLFVENRTHVATCTLWAPACTLQFALDHYRPAVEKKVLDPSVEKFAIEILSDERERADSTGPYGKSILYLVSRALEDYHKTPLLGMEREWKDHADAVAKWGATGAKFVKAWSKFVRKKRIDLARTVGESEISNGPYLIPSTHGNFDNDVQALTAALERMLPGTPPFPVENLCGY